MAERCPSCGSRDIIGKKFGMGNGSIVERGCHACGLAEWMNNRDEGYSAWLDRWSGNKRAGARRKLTKPKAVAAKRVEPVAPAPPRDPRAGVSDLDPSKTLAELFAAIVKDPNDDTARHAYADAISVSQRVRAEWIRVELETWWWLRGREMPARSPSASEIQTAAEALRDRWGDYILPYVTRRAPESICPGYSMSRGFVDHVIVHPATVLDASINLFDLAPIEHLELRPGPELRDALRSPQLARVKSLILPGIGLDDDDVLVLVREARLDRCRWLSLISNRIRHVGVQALLDSPVIRAMPVVILSGNPCDPHKQYAYDCHGTIADMWLPDIGVAAEARYGRIPWLRLGGVAFDMRHPESVRYDDAD